MWVWGARQPSWSHTHTRRHTRALHQRPPVNAHNARAHAHTYSQLSRGPHTTHAHAVQRTLATPHTPTSCGGPEVRAHRSKGHSGNALSRDGWAGDVWGVCRQPGPERERGVQGKGVGRGCSDAPVAHAHCCTNKLTRTKKETRRACTRSAVSPPHANAGGNHTVDKQTHTRTPGQVLVWQVVALQRNNNTHTHTQTQQTWHHYNTKGGKRGAQSCRRGQV